MSDIRTLFIRPRPITNAIANKRIKVDDLLSDSSTQGECAASNNSRTILRASDPEDPDDELPFDVIENDVDSSENGTDVIKLQVSTGLLRRFLLIVF